MGAYGAIHQAVIGFQTLPANVPKVITTTPLSSTISPSHIQVFIATSNVLGFSAATPVPLLHSLAAEKRLLAYLIEAAAVSPSYKAKGYQFYLAAQVNADGQGANTEFAAEPHAIAYWNLANQKEKGRWDYRFIKDGSVYTGY
jgi:hypothetical protein